VRSFVVDLWIAVSTRARSQSVRGRAAFAVLAALLTAGPLVITLTRAESFYAQVEIFPVQDTPIPTLKSAQELEHIAQLRQIRIATVDQAGNGVTKIDETIARSRRKSRPSFILRVHEGTPDQAVAAANALGAVIAARTTAQTQRLAKARVAATRRKIRRAGPSTDTSALQARLQGLDALATAPIPRVVLGVRPQPRPITKLGDRIVNALPGTFPPRPSPAVAALAGLLVALALWIAWLFRPRRDDRRQ